MEPIGRLAGATAASEPFVGRHPGGVAWDVARRTGRSLKMGEEPPIGRAAAAPPRGPSKRLGDNGAGVADNLRRVWASGAVAPRLRTALQRRRRSPSPRLSEGVSPWRRRCCTMLGRWSTLPCCGAGAASPGWPGWWLCCWTGSPLASWPWSCGTCLGAGRVSWKQPRLGRAVWVTHWPGEQAAEPGLLGFGEAWALGPSF